MIRLLYLIICFLLVATATVAQPTCTMTSYSEDTGMSSAHITQMVQDSHGMIWFATWNGLDRFDGYEFTNFKSHAGDGCDMPNDRLRDVRIDKDDNIFCRADNDWYRFDQQTGRFHEVNDMELNWLSKSFAGRQTKGVRQQEIHHVDANGYQWTIDTEGQLYYQQGEKRITYPLQVPIKDALFTFADRQKNLWLINGLKVYKLSFTKKRGQRFPLEKNTEVRCLFRDQQSRYWIATKGDNTVSAYDRANQRLGYLTPQGTLVAHYTSFEKSVYCMAQTDDGSLWLGTKPNGLFRLSPTMDKMDHFLEEESVYDLKLDQTGKLWVATMGGGLYCMMDPKKEQPKILHDFQAVRASFPTMIRHLYITADDILLAATTEGLLVGKINDVRPEKSEFRLHQRDPRRVGSLSSNSTMAILEDHNQQFYVSTESGGINRSKTNDLLSEELDFKYYDKASGMSSDVGMAMVEYQKTIWILSGNQIMLLRPRDKNGMGHLDQQFFKETYHFSEAQPIQLPDGQWLLPLVEGALLLSEQNMLQSHDRPYIALTGIDKRGGIINTSVDHLNTIELLPEERNLTLHFAALDYQAGASINYAIKMEGEEDWNYIGQSRTASFASMKPGTYQLQIRSTNADGLWVDNIRTLTIEVQPTFWEAWYGQLLLLMFLIGIIVLAIHTYIYIKGIKRQQKETLEAYLALLSQQTEKTTATKEKEPVGTQLSADDEAFMARVMTFVESHLGDADVNIGDMADAAATSKSGLNRKMKSLMGLTPADFLREARIKRACQLLTTTEAAVSDIAYQCGFTDPKYFGKCFKNTTGLSPTEYRVR